MKGDEKKKKDGKKKKGTTTQQRKQGGEDEQQQKQEQRPHRRHHYHNQHKRHNHHHHHHEHDDFDSFVLNLGEVSDVDGLLARLVDTANQFPIYRIKGYAAVQGLDARLLIQGVGDRFDRAFDRDWDAEELRQTRLVIIGDHHFDQAAISAAIAG